ncbi:MAG: hypothetical protein U0269_19810 [Polyangiales bacterium]
MQLPRSLPSLRSVSLFGPAFALLAACGAPMQPAGDSSTADRTAPEDSGTVSMDSSSQPDAMVETDAGVVEDSGAVLDTGVIAEDRVTPPSDTGVMAADFSGPGPLGVSAMTLNNVMLPMSTGCSGNDCRVNVLLSLPTGSAAGRSAPFPVAVISNGFLISASQYQSYALKLARWGYVVLRWDTTTEGGVIPRSIPHRILGNMLRELPNTVAAMGGALGPMMNTRQVIFAGHSRGGKLSALAASNNANALAFVGFDPVDAAPPGTPVGPDYPSGAAALAMFNGRVVSIGAALGNTSMFGMPCAPTAVNYQTFFSMARSPAFEVTLAQTGHVQFIDMRASCTTACALCPSGTTMDSAVTSLSTTLLVAASEAVTRGADASAYLTPTGSWISAQSIAQTPRAR